MATTPIEITKYDARGALTNPQRSLGAVMQSGDITFDVDYGNGIYARWLYVGVSGNVSVKKWDGTTQVYVALPAGFHPIASIGVNSTGTTATDLVWGV